MQAGRMRCTFHHSGFRIQFFLTDRCTEATYYQYCDLQYVSPTQKKARSCISLHAEMVYTQSQKGHICTSTKTQGNFGLGTTFQFYFTGFEGSENVTGLKIYNRTRGVLLYSSLLSIQYSVLFSKRSFSNLCG